MAFCSHGFAISVLADRAADPHSGPDNMLTPTSMLPPSDLLWQYGAISSYHHSVRPSSVSFDAGTSTLNQSVGLKFEYEWLIFRISLALVTGSSDRYPPSVG